MSFTRLFSSNTVAKEKLGQQLPKSASSNKSPINDPRTQQNAEARGDIAQNTSTLTPLQQKQRRAREALRNLQTPPKMNGSQWSSEHHRVLSENVRVLIDATSDPKVEVDGDNENEEDADDEDDEDDEEDQDDSDAKIGDAKKKKVTPPTQSQAGQKQSINPEKSTQGQKRQREEKEDNSNGKDTETGKKRRRSKKTKFRTDITQHVLEEFETLRPQPLQLTFLEHPAKDRNDEWYVKEFCALFRRISKFSRDFFGLHDIDVGEFHQPWAADMTAEFIQHVEDIAEADPMSGSWDTLLRNTIQREWLIVALIIRILEIHVFSADLWGAEQHEKDLLLDLERALFTREGFARTALRSNTVRTILGQRTITPNFHAETAKLTAKVALLLKPLTFFLYSRPTKDGGSNRTIEAQYQALHNIIAIAAYLSICIRLSPSIFYFSTVSPNTRYVDEEQHSVDAECYLKSKEAVTQAFKAEYQKYNKEKEALEGEIAKLKAGGKSDTSRIFKNAQARLDAHIATEPNPPEYTHDPMTKIGVWPNISRFKPGTEDDDLAGTPLADRKGLRIFEVCKSAVVCYYGLEDGAKRVGQRVRLEDFANEKMKRYGKRESVLGKSVVLIAAAAAAAGIPYLLHGWNLGV